MTNEELIQEIQITQSEIYRKAMMLNSDAPADQLELIGMTMLGIHTLIGEIAKRLPEPKDP
jgi:hypothetical protein